MRNGERKDVLTTGQVARICRVAPRTVSKWVDSGKLRGYRIPGSRDRRVPTEQLVAFLRAHNMPLDSLDQGLCRVLIVADDAGELVTAINQSGQYEAYAAANEFEAGAMAHGHRPHVIVLDADRLSQPAQTCRHIRSLYELQSARLVACGANMDQLRSQVLRAQGFDDCLARPFGLVQLLQVIQNVTNLFT